MIMLHGTLSYFIGGLLFGWPAGVFTALYVTRKYWHPRWASDRPRN